MSQDLAPPSAVIPPRIDLELAILTAVPRRGSMIEATRLYVGLSRAWPGLSYGAFWEALMSLDHRGLVETGEIPGRGDDPPRVTVRCP